MPRVDLEELRIELTRFSSGVDVEGILAPLDLLVFFRALDRGRGDVDDRTVAVEHLLRPLVFRSDVFLAVDLLGHVLFAEFLDGNSGENRAVEDRAIDEHNARARLVGKVRVVPLEIEGGSRHALLEQLLDRTPHLVGNRAGMRDPGLKEDRGDLRQNKNSSISEPLGDTCEEESPSGTARSTRDPNSESWVLIFRSFDREPRFLVLKKNDPYKNMLVQEEEQADNTQRRTTVAQATVGRGCSAARWSAALIEVRKLPQLTFAVELLDFLLFEHGEFTESSDDLLVGERLHCRW